MTLGERIGYLMRHKKLKQSDLAMAAGISQGAVSNIIAGIKIPQQKTVLAIAAALDIHIEDLCSEDDTYTLRALQGLPPVRRKEIPDALLTAWARDPEFMQTMADITAMPADIKAEIQRDFQKILDRYILGD